jgi:hypothetical protein
MTERFSADDAPATDSNATDSNATDVNRADENRADVNRADVNGADLNGADLPDTDGASASGAPVEPVAALSRTARVGHWLRVAVAGVFGIVYAYYLWDAIRSLIELPAQYELMGLSRDDAPWSLLILGIILPIVTYVGALIVGRHRNVFTQALVLLTGLGALAALSLGVIALA